MDIEEQLNFGLDELNQINMTQRQRNIQRHFRYDGLSAGYRVYSYRRDTSCHISVDPDNNTVFHASVGNQRYGHDYEDGNLYYFDHSQGYRWNQSNRNFAAHLYQIWSNF